MFKTLRPVSLSLGLFAMTACSAQPRPSSLSLVEPPRPAEASKPAPGRALTLPDAELSWVSIRTNHPSQRARDFVQEHWSPDALPTRGTVWVPEGVRLEARVESPTPEVLSWLGREKITLVLDCAAGETLPAKVERLRCAKATDAGLLPVGKLRHLRHLNLTDQPLTDAALRAIAGLTGLVSLKLGDDFGLMDAQPAYTDQGLSHLSGLQELRALHLHNLDVTDAGLRALRSLNKLERLSLDRTKITDQGLRDLGPHLPALRHLSAAHTKLQGSGLSTLTALTSLRLQGSALTNKSALHIGRLTSLRHLDISSTRVTDEGLDALRGLTRLTSLSLQGNRVQDLPGISALRALRALDLGHTWTTNEALAQVAALAHLERLVLTRTKARGDALVALSGLKNLRHIEVHGASITNASMAGLKALKRLEHLDISKTMVSDLRALSQARRLRHLNISDTQVRSLEALARLQGLEALQMRRVAIPDAQLRHLKSHQALARLIAPKGAITGEGLAHLPKRSLRTLDVSDNPLTDAGLQSLGRFRELRSLDLSGDTSMTEEGLRYVRGLPKLHELHLQNASVSDLGARHLQDIPRLRDLSLSGTDVTEAGLMGLAALTRLRWVDMTNTSLRKESARRFEGASVSKAEVMFDDPENPMETCR